MVRPSRRSPVEAAKERLDRDVGQPTPLEALSHQLEREVVSDEIAAEERGRLRSAEHQPEFGTRPSVEQRPDQALWRETPGGRETATERRFAPAGHEGASALGHGWPAGEETLGPAESPDADTPAHLTPDGPSGGERAGEAPGPGARLDRQERTAPITPPGPIATSTRSVRSATRPGPST